MAGSLAPLVLLFLLVSTAAPGAVRGSPYSDNLQDACNKTLFPKVCIQSLTTNPETRTADARRLAELSVYVAKEVGTTVAAFAHHELSGVKDQDVLFKCLDSCSDDIEEAVAHLSALTRELTDAKFLEVKSWLSATLGGSSTCEESCKDAPISELKNAVVTKSLEFEKLLRVTLDLITEASGSMSADVAVPPTAWAPGGSYGSAASAPGGSYGSAGAPESYEAGSSSGSSASPSSSGSAAAPSYGDSQPASSSEAPSTSGGSDAAAPSTGDSQPSSDAAAPSTGKSAPSSEAPSAGSDAAAPSTGDSAPSSDAAAPSTAPSSDAAAPSYGDSQPSAEAPTSGSDAAAPSDAPSTSEAPAPSSGDASGPAADAPAPY